jgi:hypothetical protein
MRSKVQHRIPDKRNLVKGRSTEIRFLTILITNILTYYLSLSTIQAQEATPVTGGNASGSGGTVSYTVGQVVYSSSTGSNGSVAQGVQQPFEISVVTTIEEAKGISLCVAYPNPTKDYVVLKIDGDIKTEYIASLFDTNGKLLESKKIKGNETIIVMDHLVSAVYFLKVINNNKEVKTFKIIKK